MATFDLLETCPLDKSINTVFDNRKDIQSINNLVANLKNVKADKIELINKADKSELVNKADKSDVEGII